MLLLKKVRTALTPRSWTLKTKLSNGAIVLGKNRRGYGGRGIYIFGDAIEPEFQHLDRFLPPEGVFIDIGANTGIYSMKAAKHFNNRGTVISVEPIPEMLAMLARTVEANGFNNVRLRNFCVDRRRGVCTLWHNDGKPNSFSIANRKGEARGTSVPAVSLNDLCEWEDLKRLDYLKIDAEGAEDAILEGGEEAIARFRPIVQTEIQVEGAATHPSLPGYAVFKAPTRPGYGFENVLCIPEEHQFINVPSQLGYTRLSETPSPASAPLEPAPA